MGKRGPKPEIISEELNAERKKRIWEILIEHGITKQQEAANLLYPVNVNDKTTENSKPLQQSISKQIGKKGTVTSNFCETIQEQFPEYSLEYIKGESPYKTKEEARIQEQKEMLEESLRNGVTINKSIAALGRFSGFQFDFDKSKDPFDAGTFVTITRDGVTWQLSVDEWGDLQNQICDYVEFAIKHLPSLSL